MNIRFYLIANSAGADEMPHNAAFHLGDNCIQIFIWEVYRRIYGRNLVLRRRANGAVKRDFRTYIRRYTSPNEILNAVSTQILALQAA